MPSDSASIVEPPALPEAPKTIGQFRWGIHFAIVAALPLLAAGGGVARRGEGQPALGHSVRGLLTVCAIEMLVFAVPLALAWFASRASKDELSLRWRPGYWVLPLGIAYSVAVRVIAGIVLAMVAGITLATGAATNANIQQFAEAHRPNVETIVDVNAITHDPIYFWLNLTLVSFVIGGLREELWRSWFLAGLRSLFPRVFTSTRGGIAAAGIAALFFGVAHLPQGWLAAILIALVGFGLGVIMVVHRSIWPAVVAHGLFDAASFAFLPMVAQHLQHAQDLLRSSGAP